MNNLKTILCALTFVFCVSGLANALPTTWTDTNDWNPDKYVKPMSGFKYIHDITDGDNGFDSYLMGNGGNDIIYNYSLFVALYDDDDTRRREEEIAFIDQPGLLGDGFYNFNYTDNEFGWSILGRYRLNANGKLNVTIQSFTGDFYVDYSKLVARGDNGESAPVPEPATMILLGTGIMGLTAASRKKALKK